MFCLNCGAKLEDDAVFCYNCGVRIEEKTEMIDNQSPVSVDSDPVFAEQAISEKPMETEPVVEEPTADKPVAEEPTAVEPVVEEPIAEKPAAAEPIAEEPAKPISTPPLDGPDIIFCFNCGAQNTSNNRFCRACGGPLKKDAKSDSIWTTGPAVNTSTPKKKTTVEIPWKILAIAGGAAVVVVAILLFAFSLKKDEKFMYVKDDSLMSVAVGKSKTKEMLSDFECEEDQAYHVTLSEDGKYLFYPDDFDEYGDSFELRYIRTDKKNADDEKIASDVESYFLLKNNRVTYMTNSDALYIHNLKEKEKVDSDVKTYRVSEDEKQILWLCDDGDMYIQDINLKKEAEKIASDVSYLDDVSPNFNYVIYAKDEDLYVYKNGKDAKKVCSDYDCCYTKADNDGYEIYYVETEEDTAGVLADFVVDDLEKTDKAISQPNIHDYETEIQKPSFWGTITSTEVDDAYYDLLDQYNAKVERDEIREYLSNTEMSVTNATIYYLTDKTEKTKIAEGIIDTGNMAVNYSADKIFLTYSYCQDDIEKVKLSDLYEKSDYYYLEENIMNQLEDNQQVMLLLDGKAKETGLSSDNLYYYGIGQDNDCIYYIDSEDDDTLYCESYGKNAGTREKIDDEVSIIFEYNKGKVYYIKDMNDDGEGDLYCDGEKIASDVYAYWSWLSDNELLVGVDYSDKHNSVTMCKVKGGKMTKIADDIYCGDGRMIGDGTMYLLQDYRKSGDLVYYNGRNVKVIDNDVSYLLW